MCMSEKENLDFQRAEAFMKSPAGFWTVVVILGAIVLGIIVQNVMRFI